MDSETFKQQIQKLNDSKPVISTGMEYDGLYALNNKSAEKYIRENLRGNYWLHILRPCDNPNRENETPQKY